MHSMRHPERHSKKHPNNPATLSHAYRLVACIHHSKASYISDSSETYKKLMTYFIELLAGIHAL